MLALIVDDSRAIRRIVSGILHGVNVDVIEAADGSEALCALREHPEVEFVVLDWHMPVMEGLDFAREARSDARFATLPMLMVTSECTREQMVEALELGINEYLTKPFTEEMLLQKLALLGVEVASK